MLQEIRKSRGFTQVQLAEKTGISKSLIQKLEIGERKIEMCRLDTVIALCMALDCKMQDLADNASMRASINKVT